MAINQLFLNKGIKFLFIALPQMFIGPAVMYNAFSNKQTNWHYVVLGFGIAFCLSGVYFAFQGLNYVVKGFFNDQK